MSSSDQKPDARARILRAATELLATGGRDAVTTRAVSAAAGVQPPTIYRHFGDMQGLFEAVARDMRFERGVELDRAGFLRPALDARFR